MRSRALTLAVLMLGLVLLGLVQDLRRPPHEQWTARLLITVIDFYQVGISGRVERLGVRCRFQPTCSHYAKASIIKRGALVGTAKASLRLLRCGPWTPLGTVDPP